MTDLSALHDRGDGYFLLALPDVQGDGEETIRRFEVFRADGVVLGSTTEDLVDELVEADVANPLPTPQSEEVDEPPLPVLRDGDGPSVIDGATTVTPSEGQTDKQIDKEIDSEA